LFSKAFICKLKTFFIFIFLISLSACSKIEMEQFKNNTPKLDLFSFFEGNTVAYGIFEDRFGNLKRQFRVNISGTIIDDGEKDKRVWKIKKITEEDKITYEGQAEDIEGTATGSISGNTLNWSYDIYLNIKGSNIKVHFNDWIYKQSENLAINRAYVSKFGINIGSVTLVFLRGQVANQIGPLNLKNW